jgi:hypothetical protein
MHTERIRIVELLEKYIGDELGILVGALLG